jgi:hypothetical protein
MILMTSSESHKTLSRNEIMSEVFTPYFAGIVIKPPRASPSLSRMAPTRLLFVSWRNNTMSMRRIGVVIGTSPAIKPKRNVIAITDPRVIFPRPPRGLAIFAYTKTITPTIKTNSMLSTPRRNVRTSPVSAKRNAAIIVSRGVILPEGKGRCGFCS